jgi:hypothetical protein
MNNHKIHKKKITIPVVVLYKKVAKDSGMTIKEPSVMYMAWSDGVPSSISTIVQFFMQDEQI